MHGEGEQNFTGKRIAKQRNAITRIDRLKECSRPYQDLHGRNNLTIGAEREWQIGMSSCDA